MQYTPEQLSRAGGREWVNGSMHRVYFNDIASLIGLECEYYKTGSISHATLASETISNSQARGLSYEIADTKLWFDLNDGQFHTRTQSGRIYDWVDDAISAIKHKLEA